ncbi:MAG TPA: protein kinase [Steroidobacteraceae bacterium]|nr:protein kinase [Steroidobacteraceae bacterium]
MLAPGSRLGHYEVVGALGAGGMGEVYRARDSRLGRDVALKVLPAHVAANPQRLARFDREARMLASLSHPNIATLYGIEESPGTPALVIELVEGQTLAEKLRGDDGRPVRMPLAEALAIARQIAAALDAAHERGIVHRDLKPANIALRPDGAVKVLDFGLAKAFEFRQSAEGYDPTITAGLQPGAVLGTPAYMSPEQARGQPVDKRTDIWAFGCVLYEMLSGQRAFPGEHGSEVVARVIEREPDFAVLPDGTPASVRRLLCKCFEKDPRRRLRDIGDAGFDLDEQVDETARAAQATRRAWMTPALALAGVLLLAIAGVMWLGREKPPAAPVQFTIAPPPQHILVGPPVPSPRGERLAFVAMSPAGESALWLRPRDTTEARRIAGTEGALRPFWSPDGRFVGFHSNGIVKRVDPDRGPVQSVVRAAMPFAGASWNADGVLLFAPTNRAPLHRVAAAGGEPVPVTTLDAERGENSHRFPHFLPDGRHFLFTARAARRENTGIYVGSLDSGRVKWLLPALSPAVYVPPGYVLFVRDGALLAQRFDARTLALSGDARAIYSGIDHQPHGAEAAFAASADGTVLAWTREVARELQWYDRDGAPLGVIAANAGYEQLRLSPDGKRAAVVMPDGDTGNRDIWVVELESGALTRLTSHPANDWFPVWSPDGSELLFASERDERTGLYRTPSSGAASDDPQLVLAADRTTWREHFPTDWSADGQYAVFHAFPQGRNRGGGMYLLPLHGARTPRRLTEGSFTEWIGSFSPDGKWLAFVSDESGADEIYVRSLASSKRYRVSVGGGGHPRWRRDGRELFFISPDNRLMSSTVDLAGDFTHLPPRPLFTGCGSRPLAWDSNYDITADGSRSLWRCNSGSADTGTVAVDWQSALR